MKSKPKSKKRVAYTMSEISAAMDKIIIFEWEWQTFKKQLRKNRAKKKGMKR